MNRAAHEFPFMGRSVLLVTDVQNDFCPGGALAVGDGDAVIPVIHRIAPLFKHVILTQDWHSPHHRSFASAHSGRRPFEQIEVCWCCSTLGFCASGMGRRF